MICGSCGDCKTIQFFNEAITQQTTMVQETREEIQN